MKFFLTGYSGLGKSTVLSKIVNLLREKKFIIGGIMTPEYREKSRRIGFKMLSRSGGSGISTLRQIAQGKAWFW